MPYLLVSCETCISKASGYSCLSHLERVLGHPVVEDRLHCTEDGSLEALLSDASRVDA
jgi:hypothetical protein